MYCNLIFHTTVCHGARRGITYELLLSQIILEVQVNNWCVVVVVDAQTFKLQRLVVHSIFGKSLSHVQGHKLAVLNMLKCARMHFQVETHCMRTLKFIYLPSVAFRMRVVLEIPIPNFFHSFF